MSEEAVSISNPPNSQGALRPRVLPWVVLACTLLSTFAIAYYVWSKDRLRTESAAREAAQTALDRVQSRMESYVSLLRGTAGLMASRVPDGALRIPRQRNEFITYVDRLELERNYRGVRGMGFVLRLRTDEKDAFEKVMREVADDTFGIWTDEPSTGSDELFPITFSAPVTPRTRSAAGFDVSSEPARREAILRARDTAAPAATPPVPLKDRTEEPERRGILLYLPVYHTGQAPATSGARQAELGGFVFAGLRSGEILDDIFAKGYAPIDFSIYDGDQLIDHTDKDAQVASLDTAPADVKRELDVAGRRWTFRFRPHPRPELSFRPIVVPGIIVIGSTLSLLLFMLTHSDGRARMTAERVATELRGSQQALEQANASLRESESRLRTFTDANIVGMMIGDVSGRLYEVNDAFLRLLGYTREDFSNQPLDWKTLTAPEHLSLVDAVMTTIQRTGRAEPYEKEFIRKDGRRVPVLVGKAYLGGPDKRFVGFVLDLTERKRAEQSLRASEDQLRLVTDSLPVLVSYVDGSETYRFANRHYDTWFGISAEDIVGRSVRDVLGETAYAQRRPYLAQALAGETVKFYGPTPHRDGVLRETEVTYVADRASDGTVRGIVALVADVTAQRRTEQTLRRYGDLFQHAELGLLVTGADGVTLEMANPSFERMCGRGPSAAPMRSLLEAFAPEYRTEVPSHFRIASDRGHHTFESTFERSNGSRFPVEVDVTVVKTGGEDAPVAYHILSVTDITEREHAEHEREQLLAAEQTARAQAETLARTAESANRSKDEFLATLSHELRTPLNAMLGWAQLLRSGDLGAEEAKQGLETIERNARVQAQLIDDLLDLSRIISGKLRLDIGPVDLPAVIEAALDAVRPAAEAKGIQLIPVMDSHAGPIRGDANRLQQIVWNLLSNAIKFTPGGGKVEIWLTSAEGQVEISVSDTGEGIRPEFLPHVFDRLRQADASITRKHGGLGLGLSIVRHMVELHGGTVRAQSPGEGQGATFSVRLPVSAPHQDDDDVSQPHRPQREERRIRSMPSLKGSRILVVDDEPDARELIGRILRQCGAEVSVAGSAREGFEMFSSIRPDLLISDIGMPEEDGYSLMRRVRALPSDQGGATPAIALTAFAREEDQRRALAAGFQVHLTKPVEPSDLAATSADVLSGTPEQNQPATSETGH